MSKTGEYLHRDKAYVKLVEKALDKMEKIPKSNRAIDVLISQPDYQFLDIIDSNYSGQKLVDEINKLETKLRNTGRPVPGTEGHHGVSVGSSKRTKLLPIKDRLQINAIAESRGYPVGTQPHTLKYMSPQAHGRPGKGLLINPNEGFTAHGDPWKTTSDNIVNDFKFWSKQNELNQPFEPGIDPIDAAERYIDETVAPQALFSEAAMQRPSEVKSRKALKGWLGADNFKTQDLSQKTAYYKLMKAAGIDFSELVKQYTQNTPPILPRVAGRVTGIGKRYEVPSRTLRDPVWRQTRSGVWHNLPDTREYGAFIPGAFGVDKLADYLKANWKGEVIGSILDPEVHKKLLEQNWSGAAVEAIKGAVIGGGIQSGLNSLGINPTGITPAAIPLAIKNVANVYSQHTTGKDLEEHVIDQDAATNSSAGSGGYLSSSFGGPGYSEHQAAGSLLSIMGINPHDKDKPVEMTPEERESTIFPEGSSNAVIKKWVENPLNEIKYGYQQLLNFTKQFR